MEALATLLFAIAFIGAIYFLVKKFRQDPPSL